jgi:dihydropteroate synthase
MHTRGRPDRMQLDTGYADLLDDVVAYLRNSIEVARAAGIAEERIAVDPGIGFGKSAAGNLQLLNRLGELRVLGRPILLGTSRKSFIGKSLGLESPEDRLAGSLATVALGVERGAMLFRVHDVGPSRDAALLAWQIKNAG